MSDDNGYTVNENGNTELDIAIMEIDYQKLDNEDYMDTVNKQSMHIIDQSIDAVSHKDNKDEYPLHKICRIRNLEEVVLHLITIFPQAVYEK
jgi:hypothetical protein